MRWAAGMLVTSLTGLYFGVSTSAAQALVCPADSVASGSTCIDKYEASVWETTDASLIRKIRQGSVTLGDLTAAGAVQRGATDNDYDAAGCSSNGSGCVNVYAVSVPGVRPSGWLTWFRAVAAARNSGKRLPTSAEWQVAALGTPDTGGADDGVTTCNTDHTGGVFIPTNASLAGSRASCVSNAGAFDMIGNLTEWTADWVPQSSTNSGADICVGRLYPDTQDFNCLAGASETLGPGAVMRSGYWGSRNAAGVFAVFGGQPPTLPGESLDGRGNGSVGFRAAR